MDEKKLKELIKRKGVKKKYIAEALGITPKGFCNKLNARTQFYPSEITLMAKLLGMSGQEVLDIFFPTL